MLMYMYQGVSGVRMDLRVCSAHILNTVRCGGLFVFDCLVYMRFFLFFSESLAWRGGDVEIILSLTSLS